PSAVRLGDPEGADVYVHVLAGRPTEEDVTCLRRASLARVPIVAVVAGASSDEVAIPYVLATDVVAAGESFPLEAIAHTIAARLGEHGAPLAARGPLLAPALCQHLIASFARSTSLLAAAVWVPGRDLPVLTLNELRLVLRLAQAHGDDSGRERLPELLATLGAGLALRAVARDLLDRIPVAGWAVKGAIAYGGGLPPRPGARPRLSPRPQLRRG